VRVVISNMLVYSNYSGLPLAVTLALAFATKRMTREKLLVRLLGSCETMANASVVCTDKTGTLTRNEMTVVAGSVGIQAKFVHRLQQNLARSNAEEEEEVDSPKPTGTRKHPDDFSLDETELNNVLSPQLQRLFNSSIAINSTAFRETDPTTGNTIFVGNKTEAALLQFAQGLGWSDFKKMRDEADVVQVYPFSSERKAMGAVVRVKRDKWRLYLKGASEILTKSCTRHVVVHKDGHIGVASDDIETAEIGELDGDNISRTIIFYANQTLRTLALCYRDFDSWPPKGVECNAEDDEVTPFF
jgi:Ca2+-transporting ATPase